MVAPRRVLSTCVRRRMTFRADDIRSWVPMISFLQVLLPALVTLAIGCGASSRQHLAIERLRRHVSTLADDSLEGRNAGYRGEARAADYIAEHFQRIGLEPILRDSSGTPTYLQAFDFAPRRAPENGVFVPQPADMRSQNVLGLLRGADPLRASTFIVVCAHHDSQGIEGQTDPGRLPLDAETRRRSNGIWNGADDDASGVGVLLEVAQRLASQRLPPANSVLFASFGAEEHGLFGYRWLIDSTLPGPGGGGAEYYVRNAPFDLSTHIAVLDLEMLGRNPTNDPELYVPESGGWADAAKLATGRTGLRVRVIERVEECCNHIAFHRRGVPAALLGVPGNRDHYHHPDDEAEYIAYGRLAQIARWVEALVIALAEQGS